MSAPNSTGLFSSLKRLADLGVATARNRIELFAVELQEEKCRLVQSLLLVAAVIALGTTALCLVTITIVLLFWENGRLPALMVLSVLFIAATAFLGWTLNKRLRSGPTFSATLVELQKDRACLQPKD